MHHTDLRPCPFLDMSIVDVIGACCICLRQVMARVRRTQPERMKSAFEVTSTVLTSPENAI